MSAQGLEQIRTEQPVGNTLHNLVQTLSVKLDSAARYGLYREDARADAMDDCVDLFERLARQEEQAIDELIRCLRKHLGDAR